MSYCSRCKKEITSPANSGAAKFCPECGNRLEAMPPTVEASVRPTQKSQPPLSTAKAPDNLGIRVLAIAVGCVLMWLIGFNNFHLFPDPSADSFHENLKAFQGDRSAIMHYILYVLPILCFAYGFRTRPKV
jgi:hypothetical protein